MVLFVVMLTIHIFLFYNPCKAPMDCRELTLYKLYCYYYYYYYYSI